MKARDLMIGDSVNYRGQIINVTSLYDKGGSNEVDWSDKERVWVNADNVEPIPLTPKVLEKNGFESQHDVGYVLRHYDDNTIIVDLWNHTLKILMNYKVVFEKEYFDIIPLHELQHAMHLCGIEKEIVL